MISLIRNTILLWTIVVVSSFNKIINYNMIKVGLAKVFGSKADDISSCKASISMPQEIDRNSRNGVYDREGWKLAFQSQFNEFDYYIDSNDIVGNIPASFSGTLFRNMPARFERGGTLYSHYLDGDGYIVRISFKNGSAHFISKYVDTDEHKIETASNEILFRSTFRTSRKSKNFLNIIDFNNAFDLHLKNPSNTNVLVWNGKLISFFEAGIPIELNPNTLETIGPYDMNVSSIKQGLAVRIDKLYLFSKWFHDSLFGSYMTAHYKIDSSRNNTLISWSWRALVLNKGLNTNPLLELYEWDSNFNQIKPAVSFTLTSTQTSPHDFSFTNNYYVFIENRVTGNTLPYILGTKTAAQCVDVSCKDPMIINIVPRFSNADLIQDDSSIIRMELTPGFTIHSVCAFEKNNGETIELFTTGWDADVISRGELKGGLLGSWEGTAPVFDGIPNTLLYHTVVDLKQRKVLSHKPFHGMENITVEHPHINPAFEGKMVSHIYMSIGSQEQISSPPLGYLKLSIDSGQRQEWYAPAGTFCEEIIVVPKITGEKQSCVREDDCWLIAAAFDSLQNRSCIYIFDAERFDEGPVCKLPLQHPLPHSLHGCFSSDSTLTF